MLKYFQKSDIVKSLIINGLYIVLIKFNKKLKITMSLSVTFYDMLV